MKKTLSLIVLLLLALGMQAQLLWKISGNGLQQPSYIIGTYHLAPVSFTDSIKGLKEAMDASGQVYGEIIMADMMSPENIQKIQAAMMLPDGQTLDKLFTADEMARVNTLLKNVMGVDMTHPIAAQQLGIIGPSKRIDAWPQDASMTSGSPIRRNALAFTGRRGSIASSSNAMEASLTRKTRSPLLTRFSTRKRRSLTRKLPRT